MSGYESCLEGHGREGYAEPVLGRRFVVFVWNPDLKFVQQTREENKELHLGKIFTETSAFANSKWYHVWMRDKGSLGINEPVRLELIWVWKYLWIHQNRCQVWNDVGISWQVITTYRCWSSCCVHESKWNDVPDPLDFQDRCIGVWQLGSEFIRWSSVILGQNVIKFSLESSNIIFLNRPTLASFSSMFGLF